MAEMALLVQLGFDGVFFARADYDDIKKRRKEKSMEMIWRASKSLGKSAEVSYGSIEVSLNILCFASAAHRCCPWPLRCRLDC
jgi:hypothetical protein